MRRLAFTPENEEFLRNELFEFWCVYYARRRWEVLCDLRDLPSANSDEARALKRSRFFKAPAPVDLSGACKLVSGVVLAAFNLEGAAVSNRVHTFVELSDGDHYDFNRDCNDVANLRVNGDRPYQISRFYNRSERAISGRESWNKTIKRIVADLSTSARAAHCEMHTGKPIVNLPVWAMVSAKPRTTISEIGLVERKL